MALTANRACNCDHCIGMRQYKIERFEARKKLEDEKMSSIGNFSNAVQYLITNISDSNGYQYMPLNDPPIALTTTGTGQWEPFVGDFVQIPGDELKQTGQYLIPNNLPIKAPEIALEKLMELYEQMRKLGAISGLPLQQVQSKPVPAAIIEREVAVSEDRPRRKFRGL
jgi:hypothetical protein